MNLNIETPDPERLEGELRSAGLDVEIFRARSGGDVANLILAVGGGVGIAKIVMALGHALRAYFAGRAELAQAEKDSISIRIGETHVECSSDNLSEVLATLEGVTREDSEDRET